MSSSLSRRDFSTSALAAVAGGLVLPSLSRAAMRPSRGALKVGVIGCGGRGTGATQNILEASPDVEIVAMGDMFKDRTDGARRELAKLDKPMADRVKVSDETVFHGFDAYQKVLASPVDIVILATAPGFRAQHFAAAVDAGKHVFMEKPVAVDPAGIRQVIAAAKKAKEKNLSVVAGTQRRHEVCYHEAKKRIEDGAIGRVIGATVYWNQGGLWKQDRQPSWSDMEWQIRNWLYFTWLSGDHIVEQHVHNLDVAYWFLGDLPRGCMGMGGRQVRTDPAYGQIFDHFAIEFDYPDGRSITSYCRQIDGCSGRVDEVIHGTEGFARLSQFGTAEINGKQPWKWKGEQRNPYTQEHVDLIASITGSGPYLNHGQRIAESTMLAIMGRMSAYTGKNVSTEFAMNSKLNLLPARLELGSIAVAEVAVPGKTPLI
jgi:predicted dehydrogenase